MSTIFGRSYAPLIIPESCLEELGKQSQALASSEEAIKNNLWSKIDAIFQNCTVFSSHNYIEAIDYRHFWRPEQLKEVVSRLPERESRYIVECVWNVTISNRVQSILERGQRRWGSVYCEEDASRSFWHYESLQRCAEIALKVFLTMKKDDTQYRKRYEDLCFYYHILMLPKQALAIAEFAGYEAESWAREADDIFVEHDRLLLKIKTRPDGSSPHASSASPEHKKVSGIVEDLKKDTDDARVVIVGGKSLVAPSLGRKGGEIGVEEKPIPAAFSQKVSSDGAHIIAKTDQIKALPVIAAGRKIERPAEEESTTRELRKKPR